MYFFISFIFISVPVFLANPYYNGNHSQLHIYEKSTDESLSLLHTFTYNNPACIGFYVMGFGGGGFG